MRRSLPLFASAVALAVVGTLSACSSGTPTAESTTPAAQTAADVCGTKEGKASASVQVSTDLAAEPTVTFDKGISAKTTQRTVAVKGSGDELAEGGTATVAYAVYNGATGDKIEAVGYGDGQSPSFTASTSSLMAGLAKSIGCLNEGTRVVSVVPPSDAFGDAGSADLKIGATDNLVFVIDIKDVVPTKAWGAKQDAPKGLPTVELAKDGTPKVTLPKGAMPTEFEVGVLKKGDGPVVADGATVTVQYQGTSWDTGEVFDQSWGRGAAQFSLSGVVPGFAKAIAGQTVGSQVIAVLPPADAYGEKSESNTAQLAGQTLVFVIDILAAS